ncbi:bidirectional hydrogenase complex protein HoxU [Synechococcus sp. RSCCF101]|uniref:bidirectional hydrogenase complex protein HoxU n=1 Tax=Synechococcus sp. RSCCF101 TaxID=2511069 RepID=UPI0012471472|nr:bidirectional hydrogenase complex protein HoxU [Synechococcus sp. RSCCF101]QEY33051.1 bidirectional hydrogenase complex protein HoxU [Synechococcus sp. RSCCF101]
MSVVTLTVNGQEVAVPAGTSLMGAIKAAGASVPALCHLEGLTPVGACRLCLVEQEGTGRLFPACTTEASEGMAIATHTPELQAYRRMAVELFFAEGNHVCAFCVANGACELQNVATEVGMDHSRYPYRYPQRQVDASHPQFTIDHHRCILCTRCVRVCDEIEGAHVWDVASRGGSCSIIAGLDQPWGEVEACTSCGKCVEVCPTGAIVRREDTTAEKRPHRNWPELLRSAREQHVWLNQ